MLSLASKGCFDANAAILEADDDVELLEKVKCDRKKRLEGKGVINLSNKVKGPILQTLFFAFHCIVALRGCKSPSCLFLKLFVIKFIFMLLSFR